MFIWPTIKTFLTGLCQKSTTIDPKNYTFIDKNITSSSAYYRIKQIDFDGQYTISSAINIRSSCFKAESLAAGVYFVQIKGRNWYSSVRKLVKL